MSDEIYVQQQRARVLRLAVILIPLLLIACVAFGLHRVYWDECTQSYARTPLAVSESYLAAMQTGNLEAARRCWVQQQFFSLEGGCSEICASRWAGTTLSDYNFALQPEQIVDNRLRQPVLVSVTCPDGTTERGSLILDTTLSNVPWRHFKIVYSEVGGQLGDPWCP